MITGTAMVMVIYFYRKNGQFRFCKNNLNSITQAKEPKQHNIITLSKRLIVKRQTS